MKILLLNPLTPKFEFDDEHAQLPPYGLLALGSYLRQTHDIHIVDAELKKTTGVDAFKDLPFEPDIVGIGGVSTQSMHAAQLADASKECFPEATVVWGGVHATCVGETILRENQNVDVVIYGAGEIPLMALADEALIRQIPQAIYRDGESIIRNRPAPTIPLPDLPLPAMDLLPLHHYQGASHHLFQQAIIMATRGCPFNCSYCSNSLWGRKWQHRPVKQILQDLQRVRAQGFLEVFFQDDVINIDHVWATELFREIADANLGLSIKLCFRADKKLLSPALLDEAARAGVYQIFYGVESANDSIRHSAHKQITRHEIERAVKLTQARGIQCLCSFIIGLPGETRETAMETINYAVALGCDEAGFAVATPFPGTELRQWAEKSGFLLSAQFNQMNLKRAVMRTADLSGDELEELTGFANRKLSETTTQTRRLNNQLPFLQVEMESCIEAAQLAWERNDPPGMAMILAMLGRRLYDIGEPEDAEQVLSAAVRHRLLNAHNEAKASAIRAMALKSIGRLAEALSCLDQAVALASECHLSWISDVKSSLNCGLSRESAVSPMPRAPGVDPSPNLPPPLSMLISQMDIIAKQATVTCRDSLSCGNLPPGIRALKNNNVNEGLIGEQLHSSQAGCEKETGRHILPWEGQLARDQVHDESYRLASDLATEDPQQAIPLASRAIAMGPKRPANWVVRGKAHLALANLEDAITDLRYALSLSPQEDIRVYMLLALSLIKNGQFQDAVDVLDRGASTFPFLNKDTIAMIAEYREKALAQLHAPAPASRTPARQGAPIQTRPETSRPKTREIPFPSDNPFWDEAYHHGVLWDIARSRDLGIAIRELLKQDASLGELKILDLGCGTGVIVNHLQGCKSYFGVDLSQAAIDQASATFRDYDWVQFQQMSTERLEFEENSFDAVVSREVIEHVKEPEKFLAEALRVLKPGGRLVLTSPNRDSLHLRINRILGGSDFPCSIDHVREYTYQEARKLLSESGFEYINSRGVFLMPYWGVPGIDEHLRALTGDSPEMIDLLSNLGHATNAEFAFCFAISACKPFKEESSQRPDLASSADVDARPPHNTTWWSAIVPSAVPDAPPADKIFTSTLCRQQHFELPAYRYWCEQLREQPRFHRKQWEFFFIIQSLFERGFIKANTRGIGFGVGKEPLVALFASRGCQITATDLCVDDAKDAGWVDTEQHAESIASLNQRNICPPEMFENLVSFRNVNMNEIPSDLHGFDFCWSACALEHLGSITNGLQFIASSLECLRPGGICVHTTECNISSETETLAVGPTVLFRKNDLSELTKILNHHGHEVADFDWTQGEGAVDNYIDLPPYRQEPHLRLRIEGYVSTSVGIIVRKKHKRASR